MNISIYDSYLFDPSWNTDQEVYCIRESLSVKTYWHNESKGSLVELMYDKVFTDILAVQSYSYGLPWSGDRAYAMRPERWWSMLEQDEAGGNSGKVRNGSDVQIDRLTWV